MDARLRPLALGALMLVACTAAPATPSATPTELPQVTIGLPSPSPLPASDSPTITPEPAPPTEPASPTGSPTSVTPIPLSTPTPAASPTDPSAGAPSAGCINGWTSPPVGSPEHDEGLAILEGHMGVSGPWQVAEMRYFTGPDVPWVIEPHYESVERWYVRATLADEAGFRGRWIVEKRTDAIKGVSAVAPFDSTGYQSPDWTGFVGEGPPTTYLGLPGQWSGLPYDFVTGVGDSGQPGLPDEVVDCLSET